MRSIKEIEDVIRQKEGCGNVRVVCPSTHYDLKLDSIVGPSIDSPLPRPGLTRG